MMIVGTNLLIFIHRAISPSLEIGDSEWSLNLENVTVDRQIIKFRHRENY